MWKYKITFAENFTVHRADKYQMITFAQNSSAQIFCIVNVKGAKAQKIWLKILILKYDLSKSLSKEMWCKMADTKKFVDFIYKKIKSACNLR